MWEVHVYPRHQSRGLAEAFRGIAGKLGLGTAAISHCAYGSEVVAEGPSFGLVMGRLTFHSSRLLDTANRLDPTTTRYLTAFARTVARNAGGGSQPSLGSLQIFQQLVAVRSRLAFVDISYCLAILCAVGILLALLTRADARKVWQHIYLW